MVGVIEGVRIDSDQFPVTYDTRKVIRSMSRKFSYPVEDALQECMVFEFKHQAFLSTEARNPQGFLMKNLKNILIRQWQKNKRFVLSGAMDKEYSGEMIVFTRAALHNKLLLEEIRKILRGLDEVSRSIAETRMRHVDMSWYEIYRRYFNQQMCSAWFFRKVGKIRRACGKIRDRYIDTFEYALRGKLRVGEDAILVDM